MGGDGSLRFDLKGVEISSFVYIYIYISKSVRFSVHRNPKTFADNRTGRLRCLKIAADHHA